MHTYTYDKNANELKKLFNIAACRFFKEMAARVRRAKK